MLVSDTANIIIILIISGIFFGCLKIIRLIKYPRSRVYDFDRDYQAAMEKPYYSEKKPDGAYTLIGTAATRRNVFVPNDAKHVFICGTTGSGKTVALANFIASGAAHLYPMLIIDGKGDTDAGSLLQITRHLCFGRKVYVINFNTPEQSDKYNPFKNTNSDVIKDMLINMTNWSEEHYKYNTERYVQRLCQLLTMKEIEISLEKLVAYLPSASFIKLSAELSKEGRITKAEHIENLELAKTSAKIAESAAARFATIKESRLGQVFAAEGIDIYTALTQNAIIIFILNPLLYPEMSPLIGQLLVIDSKKAISNFFQHRHERIFYLLDEINVYASSALLDLVNKSRSANVTCILATQSLADLDSVSNHFREQIIENCNNYLILRQNSSVNAEYWSNVIGTRETLKATYQIKGSSGEVTSTELGSLRKTREYIYHPDDIKRLATGEAIFLSRDKASHTILRINKPF